MNYENFRISKVSDGWILANDDLGRQAHSHFKCKDGAVNCLKFIIRKKLPRNSRMRVAVKRVVTESYFRSMDKGETYYNVSKGARYVRYK